MYEDELRTQRLLEAAQRQEEAKLKLLLAVAKSVSTILTYRLPAQIEAAQLDELIADLEDASQPITKEQSHDDADRAD